MTREPDAKFIHSFVEEFSATWVSASGDVKDRFIRAFAAGANILTNLSHLDTNLFTPQHSDTCLESQVQNSHGNR
jgi:hypothetical protein